MPINLIATVGDPAANAYADVTQADAWLASRVGAGAWAGYDGDLKKQALITMTRDIDSLEGGEQSFISTRATEEQALEFPRANLPDALPGALVAATIEGAFLIAQQATADATADPLNASAGNGNIKREKVGPIETEYFETTAAAEATTLDHFAPIVQRFLARLLRTVGDGWGSAPLYRGS